MCQRCEISFVSLHYTVWHCRCWMSLWNTDVSAMWVWLPHRFPTNLMWSRVSSSSGLFWCKLDFPQKQKGLSCNSRWWWRRGSGRKKGTQFIFFTILVNSLIKIFIWRSSSFFIVNCNLWALQGHVNHISVLHTVCWNPPQKRSQWSPRKSYGMETVM